MPECGIVDTLPAGGGLFILHKGKRKHLHFVFSLAFWGISKQSVLEKKSFLMDLSENLWNHRFFMIWIVIIDFFLSYQQSTEDQNGSLKDRVV